VKYLSSDELEGGDRAARGDMPQITSGNNSLVWIEAGGDNGRFSRNADGGREDSSGNNFQIRGGERKSFEAKNLTEFVTNNESQRRRRILMRPSYLSATESKRRNTTGTITRLSIFMEKCASLCERAQFGRPDFSRARR